MIEIEEFFVYTGDGNENVEIIEKKIVVKSAQTKWIKKPANLKTKCASPDPNDCMVWCLVEEEAVVRTIQVLVDTTQTKNDVIERIKKQTGEEKRGTMEWKEVVCEKYIDVSLIQSVQNRLLEKGFYGGDKNGKMDKSFKDALSLFQIENTLPVGQFDFETLDVHGVLVN
ncbi:MAG: peptidoglycan-binding domain-containing protein [Bacteroidota bacterium]